MLDVKKSISSYMQLSREEKVKKLKSMLELLKEDGNIFDDFYKLLDIYPEIDEEVLDTLYQALINAMYTLQVEHMEKEIEKMQKLQEKIKGKISKEEKEHVDEILDLI